MSQEPSPATYREAFTHEEALAFAELWKDTPTHSPNPGGLFGKLARYILASVPSETRPIYTVEQLESWQQSFENLRREFHRQGNHDGQRGCEFALESIRLYQTGTPVSAIAQRVSLRERDGCLWLDWSEGMLNLTHLVGRDNPGARRDMTKVMEELE